MCLEEYKANLMEFTEDELRAWTQFDQWEQQRGTKLAVDEYRIPLSRPQGITVKIPNGRIEDCDVFSQNNQIALSKHPRYYTAVSHSHTFFEVMMVCSGACRQWVEDRAMMMGQGEVCILPPGIRHAPEAFSPRDIILNLQIKRNAFHAMFHGLPEEQTTMTEFLERAFAEKPDAFLLVNTQNVPNTSAAAVRDVLGVSNAGFLYAADFGTPSDDIFPKTSSSYWKFGEALFIRGTMQERSNDTSFAFYAGASG